MAVLVAACGGGSASTTSTVPIPVGKVVDVYSSVPLDGAGAVDAVPLVRGIRLALKEAHGRAGRFSVHYISLRGSPADNARKVVVDPKAVYYIGELGSAATEVSAPILNEAGIPQLSPASTYVGLTEAIAGVTAQNEPQRYFPTGKRTLMRLVAPDTVQAAADLQVLRDTGCTKLAIANDRQSYGAGLGVMLGREASGYGVTVVSNTGIDPKAPNFHAYAETIKNQGAQCFEFAGTPAGGGVQITKDVNAVLPEATIMAPDAMCRRSWTNVRYGGVPLAIAPKLLCTRPTLALDAYPGGRAFLAAYQKAYGPGRPGAYAILGYAAMKLGLQTIAGLGKYGDNRADVLGKMFSPLVRETPIGTFGFTATGDTTLGTYGLYKVGPGGDPVFDKTLTLTKYISGSP